MDTPDPSSHPHPPSHAQPTDAHSHSPSFSPADPPGPSPHPHSLEPASHDMHDSPQHAQHAGEGDASAQERDEGAATHPHDSHEETPLAMVQEESVGAEYEQEKLAQSASLPTTPSRTSTFPLLPNWAQLQASVSSPPKPDERSASRRRSFADAGASGGGEEEERGRTIYSVPSTAGTAGEEVPIPTGEEGGGQGGSRPTLADYCVRDLALEAVRQAQIAEQEAGVGEKRARSSSEDAEGEEDSQAENGGEESPLAQRRRVDYPSAPSTAYTPQHPFAYPYPPQQTSYIHGLPHFSPPFSTSTAGGYQPYNPNSPICPPPAPGRAVWGAMAMGVYGSSSSSAAWRYDPTHALQQQQRGQYGNYQPIPSVPPLQPPVLPPIQNQGYSYPRPSPPAQQQQENAVYDSEDEESQRFESSPATTRTSLGSPATSIATPRPPTGDKGKEKEREKEVPLVSGEGGAVKLEHPAQHPAQAQQLMPIGPAPAPQQQEVAQEAVGAAGGCEVGTKRKGGRGVTPKNAFTIDPIQGVKPFIVKLRWLLMHPEIAGDVVCWSEDGHSVLVKVGGDTSRLTEDILPRTFAHSNIAAFQRQFVSYGFTSLKGADLTAALHQSSPPASSSVASTSTSAPPLPAFGPSAPNPSPSPAAARDPKEWRAYTHLHTPSDAALARQTECKNEEEEREWEDEEWWFEREGMGDLKCLGRLKAKGKGGGAGGRGRTSTAGSAAGTQAQGTSGLQVQGGATTGQGQGGGQSGVQGLLASFKLPANEGRGGGGT